MKRIERKIKILNATADRLLRDSSNYNWYKRCRCNCGQIVKSCGMSKQDLDMKFTHAEWASFGSWETIQLQTCKITGKSFKENFEILCNNGFMQKDINRIEMCGYKKLLTRMGVSRNKVNEDKYFTNPVFVAFYFYAWAQMLWEKQQIKNAIKESKKSNYQVTKHKAEIVRTPKHIFDN